ncbi:IS5 family transposase [Streptomyces globisporus]|nr:IS5 family transposase [Streptomyces globisporus]
MSDAEWAVVRPLLPMPGWLRGRGGHPEAYCHRTMLDAVRYLVDNGSKWRAIPADFPPWDRVYAFFRRWRDHGLVKEFHDRLRLKVREQAGRDPQPSAGVIDSQSVKADAVVGAGSRGFDGGKLINGRKRHAVVDTLGLLLGVMVTAADIGDRAAAQVLLAQVAAAHHRLALVWADGGYTGSLVEHCRAVLALVLAIVRRRDDMGPTVQPLGLQRARVRALTIRAERLRSAEHAVRQLTIDPADDRALLIEAPRTVPGDGTEGTTSTPHASRPGPAWNQRGEEPLASKRARLGGCPEGRVRLPGIRWAVVRSALRQILGGLLQVPEISGADARDFGDFLHRLTLTDCGHGLEFNIYSRCVSGCLGGALTLSRQLDGGNLVHEPHIPIRVR